MAPAPATFPIYGTPPPVGTPHFNRWRRTGIGGSDTGPMLGLSGYRSRLGVWQVKRGLVADSESTDRMLWGQRLEHAIRRGYVHDYGIPVTKPKAGMRHPVHEFVIGHPDGTTPPDYDEPVLLEVKTTAWQRDDWGADDTDEVPASFYSQVQHYLYLTGLPVCHLVVLVGGNQMHRYIIEASATFQGHLIEEERLLWELVKAGTPPAPDGSADAGRALRSMYPVSVDDVVEGTPEMEVACASYVQASLEERLAKKRKDVAGQELMDYMKLHAKLVAGSYSATWRTGAGRVDWQAVAHSLSNDDEEELAKYADAYRKPGRTFRVNAPKEANGA